MIARTVFLIAVTLGAIPVARADDGLALYDANCSVCHQAGGVGAPGQFPPLTGRVGKIAATAAGKTYLADVLLYGLHGTIDVSGTSYMGFMPSFKTLDDGQIAILLTHVASLGTPGAPGFTADDIKTARATPRKAKDIIDERKALDASHSLP